MTDTTTTTQTHTPKDVMNRFYTAELAYMSTPTPSTLHTFLSTLSPSILLTQTTSLPYGGTYTGHTGFQSWSSQMSEYFDIVDVQNPEFFTNDDSNSNKVIINSQLKLRVRKTQEELRYPMVQVVTVDRKRGVIEEIRPFYWDVAGLVKALALEGEEGS